MEESRVCDVSSNLEQASDESLRRLYDQIGRNGDAPHFKKRREEIEAILKRRRSSGVSVLDNGRMHHRV